MGVGEHRGLKLDVGLGPPAPPDADADFGRVETEAIILDDDNPIEVFGIRFRERVGDWGQRVEALRPRFGGFGLIEQHRQREAPLAASQPERQIVQRLDLVSKLCQQLAAGRTDDASPSRDLLRPVRLLRRVVGEFVQGEQAFISDAGDRRIE